MLLREWHCVKLIRKWHYGKLVILWAWGAVGVDVLLLLAGRAEAASAMAFWERLSIVPILLGLSIVTWLWLGGKEQG